MFENIVHEIRTPLSMIYAPIQEIGNYLNQQKGNETIRELISLIERNTERLIKLVNELLDTSKIEKGKYTAIYEYGNINKVINNTVSSLDNEARKKNIHIYFEPLRNPVSCNLLINIIEKVVTNLVSNSIKYCPYESEITVRLEQDDKMLHLIVSENGEGIPEKEQKNIFKRFYRMKKHQNYDGTGIGLSLVKELITLVKGSISLESKEGKGVKFTVVLPIEKAEEMQEFILAEDNQKPYLLLVEDNSDIISFISKLVQDDYNIIVATNGEEGLEKVQHYLPDIILTDVMMPIKDGIELLQEVKRQELTNHIPVVILSAKTSLENRLEGLKSGADAYLTKPFNTAELRYTLQNLLTTNSNKQKVYQDELRQDKKTFQERLMNDNDYVNRIIQHIIEHIDDEAYSVHALASFMCISRSQLHRKVTALTGFSATNFIRIVRLEKAKDMLEKNEGNVTEVAYSCGFSNPSYFTKSFTEYFGVNPSSYLKS